MEDSLFYLPRLRNIRILGHCRVIVNFVTIIIHMFNSWSFLQVRVLEHVHGERERGVVRADGVLQCCHIRAVPLRHVPLRAPPAAARAQQLVAKEIAIQWYK